MIVGAAASIGLSRLSTPVTLVSSAVTFASVAVARVVRGARACVWLPTVVDRFATVLAVLPAALMALLTRLLTFAIRAFCFFSALLIAIASVAGTSARPTAHASSHATVRRFLMSPIPLSGPVVPTPLRGRSRLTLTGYATSLQGVLPCQAPATAGYSHAWQGPGS